MNLERDFQSTLDTLFAEPALQKTVTYVRPPSLTHDSSTVEQTETRANCSALLGTTHVTGIGRPSRETQQFTIRATELSAILALGEPRKGDFLLDTTGKHFTVYSARQTFGTLAWRIYTTETFDEDFGAIAIAHTASADHGDLTLETTAEDYGPLYL